MKQGRASSSGPAARKREPIPHALSPAGVAQMGKAVGGMRHDDSITSQSTAVSMNAGRGYSAPTGGRQVHGSGSQGKHR